MNKEIESKRNSQLRPVDSGFTPACRYHVSLSVLSSWCLAVFSTLFLAGCSTLERQTPVPGDPAYAPIPADRLVAPESVNGSLYQVNRSNSLYTARTAHGVGDILLVMLQEQTRSSKTSGTKFQKDNETAFKEGSILGSAISVNNLSMGTDVGMERTFKGKAESDQQNRLSGSIAVTIARILPNGLLRIRGEKWLTLNQGEEYIRLTGLIRPEDISENNTVVSTKIADARIAYGATGDFDQANRMGWGGRFFNSEWWPF
ncbi:MAG: flagellar basal body L-ring protein FlgH [Proteobacteria bacterium]|nr:MAG: flagellar basal body L-ring protein FlgH [Pseudomonadota bacterium]